MIIRVNNLTLNTKINYKYEKDISNLYYSLAKFLPKSTMPVIGKFSKAFRRFCVNEYFHRVA